MTQEMSTGELLFEVNMAQIKAHYDQLGNTLTVWFGDPQEEYVSEKTGEEVILMKDKEGRVIGFEKLNFSDAEPADLQEELEIKEYHIQYPASAYTFPTDALIHQVRFDDDYMHVELTDGRNLDVPLWWIPTLHNAAPEEIAKYEISRSRRMIIWDPDKCAINDEVRVADYLGPCPDRTAEPEQGS